MHVITQTFSDTIWIELIPLTLIDNWLIVKIPPNGWYLFKSYQGLDTGRGGRIWTDDPLHPMQVRFRAAPRPDHITLPQFYL